MLLVGMLDSPYVRRVAIAGTILGVPFEHRSVSVFRHMDRFREINPLVKAPSLVADDGTVLMESQLILQHLEDVAGRSLRPREPATKRTVSSCASDWRTSATQSGMRPLNSCGG